MGPPNFSGAALAVALVDEQGNKVSSANPLQAALNASVTLEGDLEIGGVYLLGDVSGNKAEVTSGNSLKVDGSSVTQPVSLVSIPLATGAATSAAQTTAQTSLTAIAASVASADSRLAGSLSVSGLGTPFQAGGSIGNTSFGISGTLPAFASTPTVNLGTLNGAATSGKQDSIITAIGALVQAGGAVSVSNFPASQAVTGSFYQATQQVSAASLPLPSGASTAANQTTELASLAIMQAALAPQPAPAETGLVETLNLIATLLKSIDFRLRELPTNLTLSLNKGIPVAAIDSFEEFQQDSLAQLN
jgi:hypothetical protein